MKLHRICEDSKGLWVKIKEGIIVRPYVGDKSRFKDGDMVATHWYMQSTDVGVGKGQYFPGGPHTGRGEYLETWNSEWTANPERYILSSILRN